MLVVASNAAINPGRHVRVPFDAMRDLAPVVPIGKAANVRLAHPSLTPW